jgi:hypothetical protein
VRWEVTPPLTTRRFRKQGPVAAQPPLRHGCYWHGCPNCFPDRAKEVKYKTMAERYEATQARAAEIRPGGEGYMFVEVWEHDWDEAQGDPDVGETLLASVRGQLGLPPRARQGARQASIMDYVVARVGSLSV